MFEDIYVVAAVRTAIGTFGGSLKHIPPAELATIVVREAVARSGAAPDSIGHVSMGTVITTEPRDIYMSRIAALDAGLPQAVSAFNINRLCGSGLQAIVSSAQAIAAGDCEIAVGAGAESMSRAGYLSPSNRWGARMGDTVMLDLMVNALHDPFHNVHMGITAENVAERFGITRGMMDELAVSSHQRAAHAIRDGRFADQIVAIRSASRHGEVVFDTDEHVKAATTLEILAGMRPAFKRDGGTVTAGNASGINDGAAALVLASGAAVRTQNLTPIGRLVGYAYAGVDPAVMGIGPVPASRAALSRAGLKAADMDVIESNEAFAAQACAVMRELDLDPARVNPNGSGIALGHPIGATGAVIATKALHELQRIQGRYALVTMCIGGGQGIAAIFERV